MHCNGKSALMQRGFFNPCGELWRDSSDDSSHLIRGAARAGPGAPKAATPPATRAVASAGEPPLPGEHHRALHAWTHSVAGRAEVRTHARFAFRLLSRRRADHGGGPCCMPNTGILAQICGDAHVRNLGAYAAPDGRLIFDINDFDETCVAPFEWDLKRMATSLVLAGRENGQKSSACGEAVFFFAQSYRGLAASLARIPVVELAQYQVHRLERVTPVSDALHKAERETPLSTLARFTAEIKGSKSGQARRRFKEDPPLLTGLPQSQARAVLASFAAYRNSLLPERRHFLDQYRARGRRVQSGGHRQRRACATTSSTSKATAPHDPLFLQIKEEPGSAYAPYLAKPRCNAATIRASAWRKGSAPCSGSPIPFLGWTTIAHRDYLVRQLNDHKASVDLEALRGEWPRRNMPAFAASCWPVVMRAPATCTSSPAISARAPSRTSSMWHWLRSQKPMPTRQRRIGDALVHRSAQHNRRPPAKEPRATPAAK